MKASQKETDEDEVPSLDERREFAVSLNSQKTRPVSTKYGSRIQAPPNTVWTLRPSQSFKNDMHCSPPLLAFTSRVEFDKKYATKWLSRAGDTYQSPRATRSQELTISDRSSRHRSSREPSRTISREVYEWDRGELWFTAPPGSPSSIESHESFWLEQIRQLEQLEQVRQLCQLQEFTMQKLKDAIRGKWTSRFIAKRVKPKILDNLNRQRLAVLVEFAERDREEWRKRESIYVNLALRLTLHSESIEQWMGAVRSFGRQQRDANLCGISGVQEFAASLHYGRAADKVSCPNHLVVFTLALEQLLRHTDRDKLSNDKLF